MSNDSETRKALLVNLVKLPPPHWTSFSALIISIVTALILVWQGIETRSFYRTSSLPLVLPLVTDSTLRDEVGVFLRNHGGGPGIVTISGIVFDNEQTDPTKIIQAMNNNGIITQTHNDTAVYKQCGETFALRVDGSAPIIAFPRSIVNTEMPGIRKRFQNLIHKKLNVKYQWCSVYGECFSFCTGTSCKVPSDLDSLTSDGEMSLECP